MGSAGLFPDQTILSHRTPVSKSGSLLWQNQLILNQISSILKFHLGYFLILTQYMVHYIACLDMFMDVLISVILHLFTPTMIPHVHIMQIYILLIQRLFYFFTIHILKSEDLTVVKTPSKSEQKSYVKTIVQIMQVANSNVDALVTSLNRLKLKLLL